MTQVSNRFVWNVYVTDAVFHELQKSLKKVEALFRICASRGCPMMGISRKRATPSTQSIFSCYSASIFNIILNHNSAKDEKTQTIFFSNIVDEKKLSIWKIKGEQCTRMLSSAERIHDFIHTLLLGPCTHDVALGTDCATRLEQLEGYVEGLQTLDFMDERGDPINVRALEERVLQLEQLPNAKRRKHNTD